MNAKDGNPSQKDIERWLDSALRARIDAEPRSGLEDRVLARLKSGAQSNAFTWWPVLSAVAAAVVIALALLILLPGGQNRNLANGVPKRSQPDVHEAPLRTAPITAMTNLGPQKHFPPASRRDVHQNGLHPYRTVAATAGYVHPPQLPKLAAFPAPQPQTAEERMLARLAARRGSFDLAQVANASTPLKELSIPKLEIDPMEGTPPDNTPQE